MADEMQQPIAAKATQEGELSKDAKTFGMLSHLIAFAGFIFPFGNLIGPLVIWLLKKDEFPFVDDQGKESLNFQISMTIYAMISIILIAVVIGIIMIAAVVILEVAMVIIASIRANEGVKYRYPLTIRFIR
jgi:uncharacterized Tic20 family protein